MSPEKWFAEAAAMARKALCQRSKCGAVLVKDGERLAGGYNGPPSDNLLWLACHKMEPSQLKPKSDRTCCLHAEWRALLDALVVAPDDVAGSTMYFCRVDDNGEMLRSGDPYCTVCSRLTLDRGVASWALWHPQGIREYSAAEYHSLSQGYDLRQGIGRS